jgi:enolase-phosphatase E1
MSQLSAIVVDIEGTTTDINFVRNVLFPDADARLDDYVTAHADAPEVKAAMAELSTLAASEGRGETALAFAHRCIAEDRKLGPLKALQGLVWEGGYTSGRFRGHVYPDVMPALEAWRGHGLRLFVYSSGSIYAQRLLFGYSTDGDLNGLFEGNFDTTSGSKVEASSYTRIAAAIGVPADEILFLSDMPRELDAAVEAGWHVVGLARDGVPPLDSPHRWVSDFTELAVG